MYRIDIMVRYVRNYNELYVFLSKKNVLKFILEIKNILKN